MNQEKFSILIVEDEGIVAADLAARLSQTGYTIAGIADNYEEAIDVFKTKLPDLVLLDITIKGNKTGIDIAATINTMLPTPFIFVTAHADVDTLQKAKNTFPASYLLKPFTTSHLHVAVELALHNFAYQKTVGNTNPMVLNNAEDDIYLKQDYLFIKEGQTFIKLNQQDIGYLESQDNYVRFYTASKSYLVRCTLSKAIEKLKQNFMVRTHRSFCVNIHKVNSFTEHEVSIFNTDLPIGRNYKDEFISRFELK